MPTVLLVDDNRDLRQVVTEGLGLLGYDVIALDNAIDAINRLREGLRPCISVVDLILPTLASGQWLLASMKGDPDLSDLPVVVWTGLSEQALARMDLSHAAFIMRKPTPIDELARVCSKYCAPAPR